MSEKNPEDMDAAKPQVIDLDAGEVTPHGATTSTEIPQDSEPLIAEEVMEDDRPRPSSDTQREPQVIDDVAADVTDGTRAAESEPDRSAPPPPPPPPPHAPGPASRKRGTAAWIIAALVLGTLAGAAVYRGLLTDYFPTNAMKAMEARVINLESANHDLAAKLEAVTQSSAGLESRIAAVAEQIKTATAPLGDLAGRVDGLDQRIASAEQSLESAKSDLDQFRKSLSSGGAAPAGAPADNAALAALAQRIDALEKDVASLKASKGGDVSVSSALSQALADLKAKIAAGTAYADEFDRIARMVPAAPGLDVLGSFAKEGLPDAKGLAAELRAAIPALPQPEKPAETSGGYWDSFIASISGIVTIRDIGEADWPALAENAAGLADGGDLPQAIAAIDGAEGTKPGSLSQWRDRAASRLKLEAALGQVSDAVLRQITAQGGAQ